MAQLGIMCIRRGQRQGFTLIEILLVVFIILIGTAVTMPSLVRAHRGARLRTAARSLVTLHRLARGSSVLRQQSFALYIYPETGKLELVSLSPESGSEDMPEDETGADLFRDGPSAVTQYSVNIEAERILPRDITIRDIELELEDQQTDDASWINYYSNGMCDPCTVTMEDESGHEVVVELDPLSGRVGVTYE